MPYNKNQIEAYVKKSVEKFKSKYTSEQKQGMDYFVLIDTNYDSPNIAHSSGYMSIHDHLLVFYLQINMQKISKFSNDLVRFIIMHELCHSISKKVELDKIGPDWKRTACKNNIEKIKKLVKDKMAIVSLSNKYADLASDISQINCDVNPEKKHKCIDLCAKDILELNNQKFINILEELYNSSNNNGELLCRMNAAKNGKYNDCKNIW